MESTILSLEEDVWMLGLCKGGKTYPATICSRKSGSWYLHFRYLKFLVIRGFLRDAWLKNGKWTNERNESMLIYLWKWYHLGCCFFFVPPWFATLFPNGIFLHHFDGYIQNYPFHMVLKVFWIGWDSYSPRKLTWLAGCIGDEKLPRYIGTIVKRYKDPYYPGSPRLLKFQSPFWDDWNSLLKQ